MDRKEIPVYDGRGILVGRIRLRWHPKQDGVKVGKYEPVERVV